MEQRNLFLGTPRNAPGPPDLSVLGLRNKAPGERATAGPPASHRPKNHATVAAPGAGFGGQPLGNNPVSGAPGRGGWKRSTGPVPDSTSAGAAPVCPGFAPTTARWAAPKPDPDDDFDAEADTDPDAENEADLNAVIITTRSVSESNIREGDGTVNPPFP